MVLVTTRIVDELGRIVLQVELRNKLGIEPLSKLMIFENNGVIILKQSVPVCRICGIEMNPDDDSLICKDCIEGIVATYEIDKPDEKKA